MTDFDPNTEAAHRQMQASLDRAYAEIERLRAAISQIDAINDNPAHFNAEINEVCDLILRPGLGASNQQQSTKISLEHLSTEELAKLVSYPEDRPYDPAKDPSKAGGNGGY